MVGGIQMTSLQVEKTATADCDRRIPLSPPFSSSVVGWKWRIGENTEAGAIAARPIARMVGGIQMTSWQVEIAHSPREVP